jgi:hypothetical protein
MNEAIMPKKEGLRSLLKRRIKYLGIGVLYGCATIGLLNITRDVARNIYHTFANSEQAVESFQVFEERKNSIGFFNVNENHGYIKPLMRFTSSDGDTQDIVLFCRNGSGIMCSDAKDYYTVIVEQGLDSFKVADITRYQKSGSWRENLEAIDKDRDGVITKSELEAIVEKKQE